MGSEGAERGGEEVSDWIDVKQELPPFVKEDFAWRYSELLVVYPFGLAKFSQGVKTGRTEWDYYHAEVDDDVAVTHWMKRLAPPEAKAHEE